MQIQHVGFDVQRAMLDSVRGTTHNLKLSYDEEAFMADVCDTINAGIPLDDSAYRWFRRIAAKHHGNGVI